MLPILLSFNGWTVYSYPFLVGISWGVGYHYFRERKFLNESLLLFFSLFVVSWLGAKLAYLITAPVMNIASSPNFWLGGGFVFYGGLLSSLVFLILLLVFEKIHLTDITLMIEPLLIGHAIGRLGCFLAGCCYGSIIDFLPRDLLHLGHRHPVQLYEGFGLIMIVSLLRKFPAKLIAKYLISYGLLRFILEFFRGDEDRGYWVYFSPSQWISLFLVISGGYLLLKDWVIKKVK